MSVSQSPGAGTQPDDREPKTVRLTPGLIFVGVLALIVGVLSGLVMSAATLVD